VAHLLLSSTRAKNGEKSAEWLLRYKSEHLPPAQSSVEGADAADASASQIVLYFIRITTLKEPE
jgi:hypothetical protein